MSLAGGSVEREDFVEREVAPTSRRGPFKRRTWVVLLVFVPLQSSFWETLSVPRSQESVCKLISKADLWLERVFSDMATTCQNPPPPPHL